MLGVNHIEPYLVRVAFILFHFFHFPNFLEFHMSVISPQGYIEERRVQLEAREAALPVMEKAWKELHGELP